MKKIICLILVFSILSFSAVGLAQNEITVLLDGEKIEFDVLPQIINDRTMVPMRAIFEALGCSVDWVEESRLVIATYNELIILMMIDMPNMIVKNIVTGEEKIVELDSPPVIIDNRTLAPARAISEAIGCTVDWIPETSTVTILTKQDLPSAEITDGVEK